MGDSAEALNIFLQLAKWQYFCLIITSIIAFVMPFRLVLIYILCCLIEIVGYRLYRDKLSFLSALPVLCLLIFYFLRRKGDYRLKDYTYSIGLFLAAAGDIALEVRSTTVKVIALVIYMLSYSFYIATVRKEAVFGTSRREILNVMGHMLLLVSPVLLVFSSIPSDYFFASMIYMVFLALLYITALFRKTNKSSYQWFLAGAISLTIVTISEIYFSFIVRFPNGSILIKTVYSFAQFAIFMGIVRTYKNFYAGDEM